MKVLMAFARGLTVATALYLCGCVDCRPFRDPDNAGRNELPRLDALVMDSDGSAVYGQVLVPSPRFGTRRPCAIFCHGFAGFTRWDDVAHDLCRAGIVVVIPHHRGAWGSEGEYTVSGCIRDAENLTAWAMASETATKYGIDPSAVHLVGHSMGGNSVINAAARNGHICGVAMIAPCDIGCMAERMTRKELLDFLVGEGLHVLHRKSDEAVVDDILANARAMRFTNAAKSMGGRKVFLATGDYDTVVPSEPLDTFWRRLPDDSERHVRRRYRAEHTLMGVRHALAKDLADFILKTVCSNPQ